MGSRYYGYSYGNPLGPTQGVGFAKELIARLTNTAVHEGASTNRTLDENNTTFPLGRQLYADFSHDNDMTAIFSALGLYNTTAALPNTTIVEAPQADGYSAAWTASFAARAYFEKMTCHGYDEELVRILVNDRVQPLTQCGGDYLGRCTLSAFIDSLDFVKMDVSINLFVKQRYSLDADTLTSLGTLGPVLRLKLFRSCVHCCCAAISDFCITCAYLSLPFCVYCARFLKAWVFG